MPMILKAYKFRLKPTISQQSILSNWFGCARFMWNQFVENFNNYGTDGYIENLTYKIIKEGFDFLNIPSAAILQQKERDFIEFKKQFFSKKRKKKIGRAKFKTKWSRQSFRLPNQKFVLDQYNSTIKLEKLEALNIILDREIPMDARFLSVTIYKTPSGKYYASILVEQTQELKPITGRYIGIDLGLKDFITCSNGDKISNPRWFNENQVKLKKAQQHLSRKLKGSNRYLKQKLKVALIHEKITNTRNHFLHTLSSKLVNDYDIIAMEDLNIEGMKKSNLAKSVSDASWSRFIDMIKYKCTWYGKSFVQIDRFFPSSKLCSNCGYKNDSLTLDIRNWICPDCGMDHDRDLNAANNILNEGYFLITGNKLG